MFRLSFILTLLSLPLITSAQWTYCNGPEGGKVVAIDTLGGYLWAATYNGDVYKSDNEGESWEIHVTGLPERGRQQIYDMISAHGNLYIATQTLGSGVMKLTSTSDTWTPVGQWPVMSSANDLVAHGTYLFGSGYGSLARSADNGETWQLLTSGLPDITTVKLVSINDVLLLQLYMPGNEGHFYRSVNNGDTWTQVTGPIGVNTLRYPFMKAIGDRVYVSRNGSGTTPSFFYTEDGGLNWVAVPINYSTQLITDMVISDDKYVVTIGPYVRTLPYNSTTIDGWSTPVGNIPGVSAKNCILNLNGKLFFGTSGDGMMAANADATNFELINNDFDAQSVEFITGKENILLAKSTNTAEPRISNDLGQTWSISTVPDVFPTHLVNGSVVMNNRWYIAMVANGISVSDDDGQSWRKINHGIQSDFPNARSLATDAAGNIWAGIDNQLMRNVTDTSWTTIYTFGDSEEIYHIAEYGDYLFAGTRITIGQGKLYRSADGGGTWQSVSDNWPSIYQSVNGLAVQNNRIIAYTSGLELLASTDYGDTWQDISAGITSSLFLHEIKALQGKVYATQRNEKHLYELHPDSSTWQCLTCIPGAPEALSVWKSDSIIYVGTGNNGVWKLLNPTDTSVTVSALSLPSPDSQFKLFPNPSASPILVADTDQNFPISLHILDVNGKLVRSEIINGSNYRITSENLSSGLYFLKLIDDKGNVTGLKWMKTE